MAFHKAGQKEAPILFSSVSCFLCGEEIKWEDSWVYWYGSLLTGIPNEYFTENTGAIVLHPSCASKLGPDLLKDGFLVTLP